MKAKLLLSLSKFITRRWVEGNELEITSDRISCGSLILPLNSIQGIAVESKIALRQMTVEFVLCFLTGLGIAVGFTVLGRWLCSEAVEVVALSVLFIVVAFGNYSFWSKRLTALNRYDITVIGESAASGCSICVHGFYPARFLAFLIRLLVMESGGRQIAIG